MTYDVVKMGDNTYQTSVVACQLVVTSHRSSYIIPSSRFTMVDTRPRPGNGSHEIIALIRPFAACGKLTLVCREAQLWLKE